ncbi:hypothetical protein E2542_SST31550 [Spatholobus suberectus]|nr:hypothetical protein E2542_SST31550 [Spatholobus suberectus]
MVSANLVEEGDDSEEKEDGEHEEEELEGGYVGGVTPKKGGTEHFSLSPSSTSSPNPKLKHLIVYNYSYRRKYGHEESAVHSLELVH